MILLNILNISTAASNPQFEYVFEMNRYLETSDTSNQNGRLSLNHIVKSSKLINDYINIINNDAHNNNQVCNELLVSLGTLTGKIANIGIAFQEMRMVECMDEIVSCKDKIAELFNNLIGIHNKSVVNDLNMVDPTEICNYNVDRVLLGELKIYMDNEHNIIKMANVLLSSIGQLQNAANKVMIHFKHHPNSNIPNTIEFRGVFGMNEVNIALSKAKEEISVKLEEFKCNFSNLKGKYNEVSAKSNVKYMKLQ